MGTTLDLDDVAATSETAKRELADLRGILAVLRERLKAAEEVICTTKRERDCVTAEDWRRKAMHYEYQWRSCSAFANRRIGELTHSTDVNVRDDELYMWATDYEHELGEASGGTGVYASVAGIPLTPDETPNVQAQRPEAASPPKGRAGAPGYADGGNGERK